MPFCNSFQVNLVAQQAVTESLQQKTFMVDMILKNQPASKLLCNKHVSEVEQLIVTSVASCGQANDLGLACTERQKKSWKAAGYRGRAFLLG